MPTRRVKWITALPVAVILSVVLAEASPQGAAGLPDADFLEFLGSWNTGDDHPTWVDPFQLDDPVPVDAEQPNEKQLPADRHNERKHTGTDDERSSTQPSPYSVRPEGGVRP